MQMTGHGIEPETGYYEIDDKLEKQKSICDILASCPDQKALEPHIKVWNSS